MKTNSFWFLITIVIFFTGCKSNNKENQANEEVKITTEVQDMHNAQNALDYDGTYIGTLPTASGIGMKVTLALTRNGTYHKSVQYVENADKTFESEGKFTWNKEGNTITLEGEEKPNSYFVGENQLFHLDENGNRITGDLADEYRLRKQ
ncbi:copper resistance protein NlpE [Parabacteroides sp. OttesenSCG-928-G07]|nr:copper resistance protein NlpE [Parabacteroides sp. OttesenSCG-928-G21]MDL2277812.1 copper resistance protein NlpE [Parabacteroides sp. OttesenSCG-928-G07]